MAPNCQSKESVYEIDWEFSDVGNINGFRELWKRNGDFEVEMQLTEEDFKTTQNRREFRDYYQQIEKILQQDWNQLVHDVDIRDEAVQNITIMLLIQKAITKTRRFPMFGLDCGLYKEIFGEKDECMDKYKKSISHSVKGSSKFMVQVEEYHKYSGSLALYVDTPDDVIVSFSSASDCFAKGGWDSRDYFIRSNGTNPGTLLFDWCYDGDECENHFDPSNPSICATIMNLNEKTPSCVEIVTASDDDDYTRRPKSGGFSLSDESDDLCNDAPIKQCQVKSETPGCSYRDTGKTTCEGSIDGCSFDAVHCGVDTAAITISSISLVAVAILGIGIFFFVKHHRRNADYTQPSTKNKPTKPKTKNLGGYDYS